jgi:Flp pilus assembly protein TadG
MSRRRSSVSMSGQSLTEFVIVFPLMILIVFGLIQFALLYQIRATLNHATMLAARAGALHNGNSASMRAAFATGLAPLFATGASMEQYTAALLTATKEISAPFGLLTLTVLNPTHSALQDFGRARLDGVAGRELPADTLNYRNSAPGTVSMISVQDANLLHVRVRYCARLIVPVMDRVIQSIVNATPTLDCASPLGKGLRIPIQSEAIVRMQSPFYESNL